MQSTNAIIQHFKFVGTATTGDNGSTTLKMSEKLNTERMHIVFVRNLNGANEVYPPYAYLVYMRANGYGYTPLGAPKEVQRVSIATAQLTITFNNTQYARMWVFEIV